MNNGNKAWCYLDQFREIADTCRKLKLISTETGFFHVRYDVSRKRMRPLSVIAEK